VHCGDHSSLYVKQGHRDAVCCESHQAQSYFGGDDGVDIGDFSGAINDGYPGSMNGIDDGQLLSVQAEECRRAPSIGLHSQRIIANLPGQVQVAERMLAHPARASGERPGHDSS